MKARVFVGNLDTSSVTREQLHSIYAPFGEIMAISIHKGFAFVQYAYESEARNAVTFTDGSPLCGKKLGKYSTVRHNLAMILNNSW